MKTIISVLSVILLGLFTYGGYFYWSNLRGITPVINKSDEHIVDLIKSREPGSQAESPLTLPEGFSIDVYANNLPAARVMKLDALGNIWVSQTKNGTVSLITREGSEVIDVDTIFRDLDNPHGIAFNPASSLNLFIAEQGKISQTHVYTDAPLVEVASLSTGGTHNSPGGQHKTRTIEFGPDGQLYISIGSSCNVCDEKDKIRGTIQTLDPNGSQLVPFATGLRNSVFFAWHPTTQEIWATEMGRDLLGDDTPPDEINIVRKNGNYGWPICYGNNIHDTKFDKKTYVGAPCQLPHEIPSHIDLQAHSAPLGMAFVPVGIHWPTEFEYDLLVAYHGSWNRTEPTGYKVVRFPLDKDGNSTGEREDFISGWLQNDNTALGRPVDILFDNSGMMYISDDHAGVVYNVMYSPN